MPLDIAAFRFAKSFLKPTQYPELAKVFAAQLAPGTYALGTVLGLQSAAAANDVQTATVSGSPTGGTFTLNVTWPANNSTATAAIAYNASAATVQAAVAAVVGTGNVAVTGSAGGPWTVTFQGKLTDQPVSVMAIGTNSLTGGSSPTVGVVHTTTGTSGSVYGAYASGHSDGTQNPIGLLALDCVAGGDGRIAYGQNVTAGFYSEFQFTAPVWYAGDFNSKDVVGLDSGAVTALAARFISGSLSAGGVFTF
jgi:hypothetical protein